MRNKIYSSGRVKLIDAENFVTEHVISTEELDRDGEIVVFDDLERAARNYVKNPVVLFYHNTDPATPKLPIGRNLELRRESGRILARTQFAAAEDESGFTRTLWNLHVGGYLNGVSIGFTPERIEVVGEGRDAVRVVHVDELLEYSLVPIPANPEALTVMAKALADRRRVQLGKPPAYVSGFATADAALSALRAEIETINGRELSDAARAKAAQIVAELSSALELDAAAQEQCGELTLLCDQLADALLLIVQ